MNTARLAAILMPAALLLLITGCSQSDLPKLAPVTGLVTLDGEPYPNARVVFTPAQGRPAEGVTDTSGKYQLQYMAGVKGVTPGHHTVTITTLYQAPENPDSEPPFVEPLPDKYHARTTLSADVAPEGGTFDFPLTRK